MCYENCCEITTLEIGEKAPEFTLPAYLPKTDDVNGKISLSDYKWKWVLLFCYPLDFTFVCPTELIKLAEMTQEFKDNNCEIIAASTDSTFSHQAWLKQDKRLSNIEFPIMSDMTHEFWEDYEVLHKDWVHLRGAFIIDPDWVLQSMTVNNLPVGRNPEEILRTLKALQTWDLCPVNWNKWETTLWKA